MTLLLNNPPENERGFTWSDMGSTISSFCRSLGQAQLDFWGGTVISVARLLSQTVVVLAQEGFNRLSRNWGFLQRQSQRGRIGAANAKLAVFPIALKASGRLSVYKVHGALGERWTQPSEKRPIRLSKGKQNPWIAAEIRNTSVGTRSPRLEESEIRGLDDIFTVPVQGSFLDVIQPQERTSGKRKRHGLKPASAPVRHQEQRAQKPERNTHDPQTEEPGIVQEIDRMTALAEKQQLLKVETRKLSKRVKRVADSTKDWFSRHEARFADVTAQLSDKIPSPYQSYATEGEVVFAPVPPPLQVISAEQPHVKARPNSPSSSWLQASVQVSSIPLELPAAIPSPEFNGFDYMVQNNRILSRSISNLVDRYFDQSALSEDSA